MPQIAAMNYASPDDLALFRRFLDNQTALAGSTADQRRSAETGRQRAGHQHLAAHLSRRRAACLV